jgi:integrase/recombinase XerD
MSKADITLFLDMLAVERNAAPNTLAAYRRDLCDFADDLAGPLNAATTEDVRAYLARLEAHGAKASTAARRLSALKQYFQFLYAEGSARRRPVRAAARSEKAQATAQSDG